MKFQLVLIGGIAIALRDFMVRVFRFLTVRCSRQQSALEPGFRIGFAPVRFFALSLRYSLMFLAELSRYKSLWKRQLRVSPRSLPLRFPRPSALSLLLFRRLSFFSLFSTVFRASAALDSGAPIFPVKMEPS